MLNSISFAQVTDGNYIILPSPLGSNPDSKFASQGGSGTPGPLVAFPGAYTVRETVISPYGALY